MILLQSDINSIASGAQAIRAGTLLGLPTETVYGLAADADNDAAVAQIFKAKGRPADHPLIVLVAGFDAVSHYASDIPDFAAALMTEFWPGPLTLILPRCPGVANAAAGGHDTIGLRCPAHPVALALLNTLNHENNADQIPINGSTDQPSSKPWKAAPHCFGLAAPSANQFGRVSPTTAAHVQDEFGDALLILDGGACSVGIESTIIDCSRGAPVLLRPGAITPAQIQAVCGLKVLLKQESSKLTAPAPKTSGSLESHYAPKARVRLMQTNELQTALTLLATSARVSEVKPSIGLYSRSPPAAMCPQVLHRPMPLDAASAAQQLFAALRDFDQQAVKLIWVEAPPSDVAWDGVRDRLQRAAC